MREVLEKFDFNNTIAKLEEAGLLFLVMERFKNIACTRTRPRTSRWATSSRS